MRAFLVAAVITATVAPATAADTWSDPFPGVRRLRRITSNQAVHALVVDLCAPGVSVRATGTDERRKTVGSFGAAVGAQAAINGDFFSFETYGTNGPSMSNGARWGGGDHDYVAPLMFGAGKVALPPHEATGGITAWAREVVSGHPTILVGGTRRNNNGDALCTARHPRTAAGLSADKSKLILAVVDGRATTRIGMTCDELANLMKELGADAAVNLDGGGSSTMWLAGTGVVNAPSDGQQRVVANHLAIRATGTGAPAHCPRPLLDAELKTTEAPLELVSGEEAVVYLELTNTGATPWTLANTRVGTQDPQDRDSAFYKAENWVSPSRPSPPDHAFAPGAVGRFTWAMVAPEVTETTVFDETFQLVEEGVGWFGPKHTMSITVHPRTSTPPPTDGDPVDPTTDEPASPGGCSSTGASGSIGLAIVLAALVRRRRRTR